MRVAAKTPPPKISSIIWLFWGSGFKLNLRVVSNYSQVFYREFREFREFSEFKEFKDFKDFKDFPITPIILIIPIIPIIF